MGTGTSQSFVPAFSSTFEMSPLAFAGASAKEMSVGGTSMCSKVPLMLSFPPIAPSPNPICAYSAPSRAESGTPQRLGSRFKRMKNSWKVRRISS